MIDSKFLLAANRFISTYISNLDLSEDFHIDGYSIFKIIDFLKSLDVLNEEHELVYDFNYSVPQQLLLDYLIKNEFSWLNRCFNGRKVLFDSLDDNSITALKFKSCIYEVGVGLNDASENTLRWWNDLFSHFRKKSENEKTNDGLEYELKTKVFEDSRVNDDVEICSLESNWEGYDILSWVDRNKTKPLCIEVKSSIKPLDQAKAYISKNQWIMAENLDDGFMFYFWCQRKLARLSVNDLKDHVPRDMNSGAWEKFNVPMNIFSEFFSEVN